MKRISTETKSNDAQSHPLQCMEIVGGNERSHHAVSSPGLDIWVDSRPHEGRVGGDIHYFSVCGSGRVTRMALADVSGHGPTSDETARALRQLMRKHINLLDQTAFARAVNREFTALVKANYFATCLLVTYFAPTDHLIICNGGHPRPIWYSTRTNEWQRLHQESSDLGPSIREARARYLLAPVSNLPLGIIEPTDYYQFTAKMSPGDLVFFYTDGLTESQSPEGEQLGENGLIRLATEVGPQAPKAFTAALFEKLEQWRGHQPQEDDETLIVLHHNAADPPPMTFGRVAKMLPRLLGLSRV